MKKTNLIKELQTLLPESTSYGNFWIYRHLGTKVNNMEVEKYKVDNNIIK